MKSVFCLHKLRFVTVLIDIEHIIYMQDLPTGIMTLLEQNLEDNGEISYFS